MSMKSMIVQSTIMLVEIRTSRPNDRDVEEAMNCHEYNLEYPQESSRLTHFLRFHGRRIILE